MFRQQDFRNQYRNVYSLYKSSFSFRTRNPKEFHSGRADSWMPLGDSWESRADSAKNSLFLWKNKIFGNFRSWRCPSGTIELHFHYNPQPKFGSFARIFTVQLWVYTREDWIIKKKEKKLNFFGNGCWLWKEVRSIWAPLRGRYAAGDSELRSWKERMN